MFRVYNPTRRRSFPKEIFVRISSHFEALELELLKTEREKGKKFVPDEEEEEEEEKQNERS